MIASMIYKALNVQRALLCFIFESWVLVTISHRKSDTHVIRMLETLLHLSRGDSRHSEKVRRENERSREDVFQR